MAYTKNAVLEKYDDGLVAVIDTEGIIRLISDDSYSEGQILYLDTEALDIAEMAASEDSLDQALGVTSIRRRVIRAFAKHIIPIAASFALVLILGVGGTVYGNVAVASEIERDGISYELNYFHKVIGVKSDDLDEKELLELKRDIRGKRIEEAVEITKEKHPKKADVITEEPASDQTGNESDSVSEEEKETKEKKVTESKEEKEEDIEIEDVDETEPVQKDDTEPDTQPSEGIREEIPEQRAINEEKNPGERQQVVENKANPENKKEAPAVDEKPKEEIKAPAASEKEYKPEMIQNDKAPEGMGSEAGQEKTDMPSPESEGGQGPVGAGQPQPGSDPGAGQMPSGGDPGGAPSP